MNSDNNYWTTLKWPAAPNLDDYRVFESYCTGRVLLLGSTKLLLPLCTEAWDIEPKYDDPKIKQRDWFNLDEHWDTIILDGGLVMFDKEPCDQLVSTILSNCDRFISRSFLNPSWNAKYAKRFPKATDFDPVPTEITINEVYSFYIWQQN